MSEQVLSTFSSPCFGVKPLITMDSGGGELLPADDELPGHEDGGEGGEAGPAGTALLLREDRLQRPQRQVKECKAGRMNYKDTKPYMLAFL
jgi:hypothetical protein